MESEQPGNAMMENSVAGNNHNETTPMDTDENVNNASENMAENTANAEQHMDTDNSHSEGQKNDNLALVGSQQEGAAMSTTNTSTQGEHMDASHENLATLAAAVTAAGGTEVNANTNQMLNMPAVADDLNKATNAEQNNQNTSNNNPSNNSSSSALQTNAPIDEEDAKWHTVGVFPGLSTTVTSYIDNMVWSSSGINLNAEDIPDLSSYPRISLEPGTAYRFRIRALNSVGASDWSEISSFKTCLPGFPGAPSAIKISKSSEGAHLTWEPPPSCVNSNEIIEYSVYLAVKPGKEKDTKAGQRAPAQLAFVRVYVGPANQCTVSQTVLSGAHVDCSNKPAIIFRIAARNEKGYGPATQVRWLQDAVQNSGTSAGLGANSLLSPTRVKPELTGASPNKRFKAAAGGGR